MRDSGGSFMSDKHLGACLCGAVRFEVDGAFDRFYLCHCESCRKDSGSAHAANLFSSFASLASWEHDLSDIPSFFGARFNSGVNA